MSASHRRVRDIIGDVLALSSQGLPCFPCNDQKRPTTSQGFKNASRDPNILWELWRQHPGSLIGVPSGAISGLDVLDIDARHGGAVWFAKYRGDLPPTRVHRTRSGGLHLLFRHHSDLRCSAGRIAPGVDVRAAGGYLIWWPAAGFPVVSDLPPAAWPEWLLKLTRPTPRMTPKAVVPDDVALMRLVRLIATAPPGQRNNLTYWAACRVGEMVNSGILAADTAAAVIAEAATRTGLPFEEAKRTAWSGIRTGGGRAHA